MRRCAAGESLEDCSPARRRVPARTAQGLVEAIAALRRLRMTAVEIAELLGLALSTVSLWLKRIGLGKRSRLEPPEPPNRYERARPGELVHVDIKQLGRISAHGADHRVVGHRASQISTHVDGKHHRPTGFEYVHVMIDDHSRVAYLIGRIVQVGPWHEIVLPGARLPPGAGRCGRCSSARRFGSRAVPLPQPRRNPPKPADLSRWSCERDPASEAGPGPVRADASACLRRQRPKVRILSGRTSSCRFAHPILHALARNVRVVGRGPANGLTSR